MSYPTPELQPLLEEIGSLLNETGQTLAIAESTTGGLLSAALLSVNGAAGWYKGGAVLYTLDARSEYAGWTKEDLENYRGPTEDVASTLANGVKKRLNATLCIGEAGIAGPMSPSRRLPP
ncbi:hypothetical protein L7F22_002994 [Adiantum nelumboides]|nr:hypothetical protein [Adiantum nelumboides]